MVHRNIIRILSLTIIASSPALILSTEDASNCSALALDPIFTKGSSFMKLQKKREEQPTELEQVKAIAKEIQEKEGGKGILFGYVRLDGDRPVVDYFRTNGNSGFEFGQRINVVTQSIGGEGNPMEIDEDRPLCFIVPIQPRFKPDLRTNLPGSVIEFKSVKGRTLCSDKKTVIKSVEDKFEISTIIRPRKGRFSITFKLLKADVDSVVKKEFVQIFAPSSEQDYSTKISVFRIFRKDKETLWGLNAPLTPLGVSKAWSLDAVTIFGATADADASLGAGFTYRTRIGSSSVEGYRGIFGFPLDISFTFGWEALDLGRPNTAKSIYFGVGLTIPTGGKKSRN
jgi:hypothetical protein